MARELTILIQALLWEPSKVTATEWRDGDLGNRLVMRCDFSATGQMQRARAGPSYRVVDRSV